MIRISKKEWCLVGMWVSLVVAVIGQILSLVGLILYR